MSTRIQHRRDTAVNWQELNPVLRAAEWGMDLSSGSVKLGDGVTPWNDLPYYGASGGGGGGGEVHIQDTPLATWVVAHTVGRRPNVAIYLPTGEEVDADVVSSPTVVTITFPSPTMGQAVLT